MIPKVTQQAPNIVEQYWCSKCGRHLIATKNFFHAEGYLYCPGCGEPIEWDKAVPVKWTPMSCENCGRPMLVELGGQIISAGEYVGGPICRSCMEEYCRSTNCLACTLGTYPNCKWQYLKQRPVNQE